MLSQKNQVKKNLTINIINLIVNISIGLFYTPYLVKSLGIIAYGIVPLAFIINQYVAVVTGSLTGSLTRFYSVSIQKKEYLEASNYLSSALVAISSIILVLSPLCIILILNIGSVFNIPVSFICDAKILFAFSISSFFISLYSALFNVTLYASNRLDIINLVGIYRIIVKVGLIYIFFETGNSNICIVGFTTFIAELIVLFMSYYYFLKSSENKITVSLKYYEKSALLSIIAMTSWVFIHQIGDTALYRIDNVLVNQFWSTKESGILGALTELGSYVSSVVSVVSTLFGPLILIAYANGDHTKVKELSVNSSLLVGVTNALLIGVLIGFAHPIIKFWLGENFVQYSAWLILKLVTLPFYLAAGIFSFVYRAWNQVKYPAIITLIIGAFNFLISYIIFYLSEGNELFINYMLLFSVVCIILQSYILNSYFFHKIYPDVTKSKLISVFLKIILSLCLSVTIALLYSYIINVNTILSLFIGILIVSIVCLTLGFFWVLDKEQRQMLIMAVKKLTSKIKI